MSSFADMIAARLAKEKKTTLETTPVRVPKLVEEKVERRPFEHYHPVQRKPMTLSERFSALHRGLTTRTADELEERMRAARNPTRRVTVTLPDRSMAAPHSLDAHYHRISEKSASRAPMYGIQGDHVDPSERSIMYNNRAPLRSGFTNSMQPQRRIVFNEDDEDEGDDFGDGRGGQSAFDEMDDQLSPTTVQFISDGEDDDDFA